MSQPFIGEIRMVSFTYAPRGWALCNGQILPINQNQALFSLLGTTFGGNGQTTFALPNLQGRVPTHVGNGMVLGQFAGEENHTVTSSELPAHGHAAGAAGTATTADPTSAVWAGGGNQAYVPQPNATMDPSLVSSVGGGQPHPNMQPYLTLNFVIALQGIFPSRN